MGLREINATRTRQLIADAAMELFVDNGYEATTMEDVALRAGIGTSTLYRYFSTKEQLVTAPLGDPGLMADELHRRPPEEEPDIALGHAVLALLNHASGNEEAAQLARRLLNSTTRTRTQLLDWQESATSMLRAALAQRIGTTADDPRVHASASMATVVLTVTNNALLVEDETRTAANIAIDVMEQLHSGHITLPRSSGRPQSPDH